jgi:hypothetical protein
MWSPADESLIVAGRSARAALDEVSAAVEASGAGPACRSRAEGRPESELGEQPLGVFVRRRRVGVRAVDACVLVSLSWSRCGIVGPEVRAVGILESRALMMEEVIVPRRYSVEFRHRVLDLIEGGKVELLNRQRWNTRLGLAKRYSSTLRSSTTGNDGTRDAGCSARSSMNSVARTTWPAIKQADRTKPVAHDLRSA